MDSVAKSCHSLCRLDVVYGTACLPDILRQDRQSRGEPMAYAVVHQFAGGTEERYKASLAAVHPSDGSLPAGQVFHAAGPSADGWTIVAIHESPAKLGAVP